MKLFCLPCAGASANVMYLRWKKLMPDNIEIIPVEVAGRGSRISEAYICNYQEQIEDLYDRYFKQLRYTLDDYIIFGHSMGALLSYGLLGKLHGLQGNLPKSLIVSATSAPSVRDSDRFQKLDDQSLVDELKLHGGTSEVIFEHPELLDMTINCLRADYKTCNSFEYSESQSLKTPIHVFGGIDDEVTLEELQAWQKESNMPITIDKFDGGHFYLQPDKSESQMINRLQDLISDYN